MSETTYIVIYFVILLIIYQIIKFVKNIFKKFIKDNPETKPQSFDRDFEITEEDEDLSFFDNYEFQEKNTILESNTNTKILNNYSEIVMHNKNLSLKYAKIFKENLNLDDQQTFLIEMEIFFYYSDLLILLNISRKDESEEPFVFSQLYESIADFQQKAITNKFVTEKDIINKTFQNRLLNYDKLNSVSKNRYFTEAINYQIELIAYIIRHSTFHYYNLFPKHRTEQSESEPNTQTKLQIKKLIEELIFGEDFAKKLILFKNK